MVVSDSLPGFLSSLYCLKNSFLYLSYRFLDFFLLCQTCFFHIVLKPLYILFLKQASE